MDYSVIKRELKNEGEKLLRSSKYKMKKVKGLDFLDEYAKHIEKGDTLTDDLTDTLNKLIEKHKIVFQDELEKESFLAEMRPVILEIHQKFAKPN